MHEPDSNHFQELHRPTGTPRPENADSRLPYEPPTADSNRRAKQLRRDAKAAAGCTCSRTARCPAHQPPQAPTARETAAALRRAAFRERIRA